MKNRNIDAGIGRMRDFHADCVNRQFEICQYPAFTSFGIAGRYQAMQYGIVSFNITSKYL